MKFQNMAIQYLALAGLLIITAGWFSQYLSMKKGKKKVNKLFPTLNVFGSFILLLDAFQSGAIEIAIGNVLTLIGAALVFFAIKTK